MNSCEIMNHNWVSVAFNGDLMHFEIFYTHTHNAIELNNFHALTKTSNALGLRLV